ncbi:MAG TPA: hypothetical protein VF517_17325 [Thermoleophilaceae bacterium]|jgi:hypothetical protein
MFRKLSLLALLGGATAFLLKKRSGGGGQEAQQSAPMPSTSSAQAPDVQVNEQQAPDTTAEDLAEVRPAQTEETIEAPIAGIGDDEQAVIPDISNDDQLVREQEAAAAADAGSIGGDADTVTADAPEEMRPVVEGAGDAPETFETTDEQGR